MKRQLFAIAFAIIGTIIVFAFLFSICGCMQAIVEKPDGTKYKVNTFLYKLDVDKITGETMTVEKWRGDPGETEIYTPSGIIKHK